MLNAGRVRDIASGVSSELWHGRRLRHAKHRIAYLPSSEQLISFQLINRSLESSRERANFFLQQKNSNLLSLSIRIEFLISNETRATNGYTEDALGRARVSAATGNRIPFGVTQYWMETKRHARRGRVHPPRDLLFHDAGSGTGGTGSKLLRRRYLRNKETDIHRDATYAPPRSLYRGSIVYRIVRSINHRPKKSGDFLTRPIRGGERITFLVDRNDHYHRSRKKDRILSTSELARREK